MLPALLLAATAHAGKADEPMSSFMEHVRAEYGLPSICAGAIVEGKIVSLDVVGLRRLGADDKARADDTYHCGSITKSFTAALYATSVQQGVCAWTTPLRSLFTGFAKDMDPAFLKVTALDLVAHRSGLPEASWPDGDVLALQAWSGHTPSLREEYARRFLTLPPDYPPESKMVYSNANYVILGAAMEGLAGTGWEELLTRRLLRPLGLKSAGFGAVGADGKTMGPWGHRVENGKLTPVPPGPDADNPLTLGPAATLHMSVPDLLKWCAFQADEGQRGGPLTPASFAVLHSRPFGDYGGGLIAVERGWGGGLCFNHAGSNTMNYENLWIAPRKRFGLVVATNAFTPDVAEAVEEITAELIRRYCPK